MWTDKKGFLNPFFDVSLQSSLLEANQIARGMR